jgi:large subunit ribosomal protein L15
MPLQRRIPKVGFKNPNRVEYVSVNLDALQKLSEEFSVSSIDFATLKEHGLVSRNDLVKILGRGELKAKLEVTAHAFSAAAKQAIEAAGGAIVKLKANGLPVTTDAAAEGTEKK